MNKKRRARQGCNRLLDAEDARVLEQPENGRRVVAPHGAALQAARVRPGKGPGRDVGNDRVDLVLARNNRNDGVAPGGTWIG